MKLTKLKECGYNEALLGLSLSYNSKPNPKVALILAHRQGGHNKFLESIIVWLDITAPLFWWKQFDTYRLVTKQSESTMHTVMKRILTEHNFEYPIPDSLLHNLNSLIRSGRFTQLNNELPQGFLQRRVVCTSYKTLQNMYLQRKDHKLVEWNYFLSELLGMLEHPKFIER